MIKWRSQIRPLISNPLIQQAIQVVYFNWLWRSSRSQAERCDQNHKDHYGNYDDPSPDLFTLQSMSKVHTHSSDFAQIPDSLPGFGTTGQQSRGIEDERQLSEVT
jgi:hypothetical protein